MKTFKYHINGRELSIRLNEKQGTIAEFLVDGAAPAVSAEDMPRYAAVIALALLDYEVEVVHDDETGVITLESSTSQWGCPSSALAGKMTGNL